MQFVFDTNVLIDGFSDDFNAQSRLIKAVQDGEIDAIVTPEVTREYRRILRRLIEDAAYRDRVKSFLDMTLDYEPKKVDDIVIDDPEDIKFVRAALGGGADAIVTSDKHLLDVGEVGKVRIIKPTEAWAMVEEDGGGGNAWHDFIHGLGISR